MKKLVGVWYRYDDGSREYDNTVDNITVFSLSKWLMDLISRKKQSPLSNPSPD